MLKGHLIHPELLRALGAAGHGAKVLLADGNYPVGTMAPAGAARVYLNLSPGVVTVTDVLRALVTAIPIEKAEVMVPDVGPEPAIFAEFRTILEGATTWTPPGSTPNRDLSTMDRFAFYAAASEKDVAVVVATGERRVYANLLLTIGVVDPDTGE
jgi:L-fucose mutarotase